MQFVLIVVLALAASVVAFIVGALWASKIFSDGKAVFWQSYLIPMGVPFKIGARLVQYPDHALINFFDSPDPILISLPKSDDVMAFAPNQVIVKYIKDDQVALRREEPLPKEEIEILT